MAQIVDHVPGFVLSDATRPLPVDLDITVGATYRDNSHGFVVRCVIPEGSVVVDRARFERLREWGDANLAWVSKNYFGLDMSGGVVHDNTTTYERLTKAQQALQPGDFDPLPD